MLVKSATSFKFEGYDEKNNNAIKWSILDSVDFGEPVAFTSEKFKDALPKESNEYWNITKVVMSDGEEYELDKEDAIALSKGEIKFGDLYESAAEEEENVDETAIEKMPEDKEASHSLLYFIGGGILGAFIGVNFLSKK